MKDIINHINKYGIVLILSSLFGHLWFYLQSLLFSHRIIDQNTLWYAIPTYTGYFFQVLVSVLLFIDIRKYNMKYYLIPIMGLFYPLLGVSAFLILHIYKTANEETDLK